MNTEMNTGQEPRRRSRTTGAKPVSVQTVIQMIFDEADTKEEAAVDLVIAADTNQTLRNYLITVGAKTVVGNLIRSDNAKIFNDDPQADVTKPRYTQPTYAEPFAGQEPPLVSEAHKGRQRRVAKTLELLAVRLPNGTLLRDARQSDLEDAANRYGTQAKDMLHKSTFYSTLCRELPKGKKVGDVMDNVVLTSIWEQTKLAV